MKARKPKATEPSLKDQLAAKFTKDFLADYDANGVAVIQRLREKHPDRYIEQAARLIAQAEPPSGVFDKAKSMQDIGRGLLQQVGIAEDNMTDEMIEAAIAANDKFVRELERIATDDEFARLSMAAALEASGIRQ